MNKVFKLEFSHQSNLLLQYLNSNIRSEPLLDEKRLLTGHILPSDEIKQIIDIKGELDHIFDNGLEKYYCEARNIIFTEDSSGSKKGLKNRAGDKLQEINEAVNIFDTDKESPVFFDIAAGPGAWSDTLLRNPKWSGYGMTLNIALTPNSDTWYSSLEKSKRWRSLWGVDGTGDIYNQKNIEHAVQEIQENLVNDQSVALVMGDGGFSAKKDSTGIHQEAFQELYSFRLILSEFIVAIQTLDLGGNFVCKLFDTSSDLSISLIYCSGTFFEEVYIVKPIRSRDVNSERYIVCKKFLGRGVNQNLKNYLIKIHKTWQNDENVPITLIPWDIIKSDDKFITSFKQMVKSIYDTQKYALQKVIKKTNELSYKK